MKKILIDTANGNRICDIVGPGQEFEVFETLVWVDAADDVGPWTHTYDGVDFNPIPEPPKPQASTPEAVLSAAGLAKELIDLGVKKADGTPLVIIDFSQPIQDVLNTPVDSA